VSALVTAVDLMMARERDAFVRRMKASLYRNGWFVGPRFEATHYTAQRLATGPNSAKQRRLLKRRMSLVAAGNTSAMERAIAEGYAS
jgi:hypothetical protein